VKMIDTSAWIEYLRGTQSATHLSVIALLDAGEAAWCDMVLLELANGGNPQHTKRIEEIKPLVWMFEIDRAIWQLAETLAARGRAKGITIPATDILIAACARKFDLEAAHHGDDHFDRIAQISLS
jgi:predicted nucleic acid-binding protein